MAKQITVNSGPHKDLKFIGHTDASAYDQQAGQVGACVECADLSDIYRSLLPEAHEKFVEVLEKKSGIKREENAKATEAARQRAKDPSKVDPVPESYVPYANRVKAELSKTDEGKTLWAQLDAEIHDIASEMTCDSSPTARQKGPDKGALAKADDILSREESAMEAAVTKLLNVVDGFDLERDEAGKPERTSLARLVSEFVKQSL